MVAGLQRTGRSLDFTRRRGSNQRQAKLPVMHSRCEHDWLCSTATPLPQSASEQLSHIHRRNLTSHSAFQYLFGHPFALSAEVTLHPPRKAVASGCPSSRPAQAKYHRPPRTVYQSVPSCLRCKDGSEHLAVCISLQCMLSPPRHNRRVTWRRTGMRYAPSASKLACYHPRLTSPVHPPWPWC